MSNEKEETRQLEFSADASNAELANLTGPLDANLRQIETILDVSIARRGNVFRVSGSTSHVRRAIHALQRLLNRIRTTGEELSAKDLQLFFVDERTETEGVPQDDSLAPLKTRRRDLRGRTPRQHDYIKAIQDCDIAFGIGPAAPAKRISPSPPRWTPMSGIRLSESFSRVRRLKPEKDSASFRAIFPRRWIPICARFTTRFSTFSALRDPHADGAPDD